MIKYMITEIAFTGTPVTDIKRAREFYEDALGLKPTMESAGGHVGRIRNWRDHFCHRLLRRRLETVGRRNVRRL